MKFPWSKSTREAPQELAKYVPPTPIELGDVDMLNGWTAEGLAEYRAESDRRAMAIVSASMDGRNHPDLVSIAKEQECLVRARGLQQAVEDLLQEDRRWTRTADLLEEGSHPEKLFLLV